MDSISKRQHISHFSKFQLETNKIFVRITFLLIGSDCPTIHDFELSGKFNSTHFLKVNIIYKLNRKKPKTCLVYKQKNLHHYWRTVEFF